MRWVIGLFVGVSISALLVGGFGYSLVTDGPAPPGVDRSAVPAAPTSMASAPATKPISAPPAPTVPPAVESTAVAAPAPKVQPAEAVLPATPPAPTAAAHASTPPAVSAAPAAAVPAAPVRTAMPAEAAMSESDRQQVQEALHRAGYDPGPADGVFGPLTRAAIRRFQKTIGTDPTGIITADEASRLVSQTSEAAASR